LGDEILRQGRDGEGRFSLDSRATEPQARADRETRRLDDDRRRAVGVFRRPRRKAREVEGVDGKIDQREGRLVGRGGARRAGVEGEIVADGGGKRRRDPQGGLEVGERQQRRGGGAREGWRRRQRLAAG